MSDLSLTSAGNLQSGDYESKLRKAAAQFEAQFVNILLKESRQAREATGEGGLLGGSAAGRQFNDLFDSAVAEQAAGDMGIAEILVQQIVRDRVNGGPNAGS